MIMNRLTRSVLLAAALLAGGSAAAMAVEPPPPDQSDPYGGYYPNSPEGQRAFWDYQTRKSN
jgi:hypothetical protein